MNLEAAARELYRHWCEDDGKNSEPPDWGRWDADADLNGHGLMPSRFREEAAAINGKSLPDAARELCFRGSGCGGVECRSMADCTVDPVFVEAARRAQQAGGGA